MKKKTSLRTIGPIVAISVLLDGNHIASLNSCRPVSANWNATTIKITLVAAKKRCSGIFSVPWKKKRPTATASRDSQQRADPDFHARAR